MKPSDPIRRFYSIALALGIFTIIANLFEGIASVWLGYADETLALFGFGLDSFIEVLSAVGVVQMVLRIRAHPESNRSRFERTALRITGVSFYLLAAGLVITAAVNTIATRKPETAFWGIVISLISLSVMIALVYAKLYVGKKLDSAPIIADAHCTRACVYMSCVLLAASLAYQLTGIGYLDSLGAAGIAWLAFSEGREAFEKANARGCGCGCPKKKRED
jgi:divalent metal cation (Fe/Co/Zn/Cd) transporter